MSAAAATAADIAQAMGIPKAGFCPQPLTPPQRYRMDLLASQGCWRVYCAAQRPALGLFSSRARQCAGLQYRRQP